MSESLLTNGDNSLIEDFSLNSEVNSSFPQTTAEMQSTYCLDRLMCTDLLSVRHTVEYLQKNSELPFPHPSSKECAKAARVVASSLDFLRDHEGAVSSDQLEKLPSMHQAVMAMQEVFGDPLADTVDTENHPLAIFFTGLSVNSADKDAVDLANTTPETLESIMQFVERWEELEDERIMASVHRARSTR